MASLFDMLWSDPVSSALDRVFGETVTLQRGSSTTAGVTASWDGSPATIEVVNEIQTARVDRTWIVAKAAYLIGGVAVEPQSGDRLIQANGGTWEVLRLPAIPAVADYGGGHEWQLKTKQVV